MATQKGTERLDKLVAAQTSLSRRDVHKLLSRGLVLVNGEAVRGFDTRIDLLADTVVVDGQPLALTKYSYLMMNKPRGVVSATSDAALTTVLDLVPPELLRSGLFPAGRLDKETTGFVLLTNDGEFAHRILSPRSHVPKTYLAQVDKPLPQGLAEAFAKGVPLAPESHERRRREECPERRDRSVCLPALLEPAGERAARVTIRQGMYHQVRRMFEAFGLEVVELHRERIGGLALDPALEPGKCREITRDELAKIEGEQP